MPTLMTAMDGCPVTGPRGEDATRIAYTRRSRRILYGEHAPDVQRRLAQQLGTVREEAIGALDLSSNPFKLVWASLATLYDRAPTVSAPEKLVHQLDRAGLWPMMCRVQRDCLALREEWVWVDVAKDPITEEHELVFEPVHPDLVVAEDAPDRPGVPVRVWRAVRRQKKGGDVAWMWDHLDVSNPDKPVYEVFEVTNGKQVDRSKDYGVNGWPELWRDAEGRPVLPCVLYHASRTPRLYDPYQTRELVEGTLNSCLMRTHLLHVVKQASWAQRFVVNAAPAGMVASDPDDSTGGAPRSEVPTDPSMVLVLVPIDAEAGQAQTGQWGAPQDPNKLMELIEAYERKLMAESGVRPDVTRTSGDPRSGYALAVDTESQREAQRRFEPQFRRGDEELLRVAACQWNRATKSTLPETGHTVTYHGVPKSAQELKAQREHLLALIEAGLISPIDAYQELNPGTNELQAAQALLRIQELKRQLAAPPPANTTPTIEETAHAGQVQ